MSDCAAVSGRIRADPMWRATGRSESTVPDKLQGCLNVHYEHFPSLLEHLMLMSPGLDSVGHR